jgi:hypothetical protein
MSTQGDDPIAFSDGDFYFELEHNMTVNSQGYEFLADALARHWREYINPDQLRRMQTAYTHEHGFGDYDHQQRIYPQIPGLEHLGHIDRDMFHRYFTSDGEVFLGGRRDLNWNHRQDDVNPLREHNAQDSQVVLTRRRGTRRDPGVTRRQPIREYLGAHQVDNPEYNIYNPEYQTNQENIEPDDFINF